MTTTVPILAVKQVEHHGGVEMWVVDCPYCGREHRHSAEVGHRVSHCQGAETDPGYVLVALGRRRLMLRRIWRTPIDEKQSDKLVDAILDAIDREPAELCEKMLADVIASVTS